MKKIKKVYCINCTYFIDSIDTCRHPDNIITTDTWKERRNGYLDSPDRMNDCNNCKNYNGGLPEIFNTACGCKEKNK